MIEVEQLSKTFGVFRAVENMTFQVRAGEVVALLGPNGAGKTTTVRMLSAILQPSSGSARIAGYDVVRDATAIRRSVGLLTEFPGLYQRMRPMEYLEFFGALQGVSASVCANRSESLLRRFGLWEARNKRLDSYSKGMKQKVALIRALIHEPPVLYLDEPTTAMDPHSAYIVRDAIAELRAARRTIVLTTHNLAEAEALADRILVVRSGRIVAEGTREELTRQLLGEPVWELHTATAHTHLRTLVTGVEIVYARETDVHYRTSTAATDNPRILADLASAGVGVVSLATQSRSLEDVYLRIISSDIERGTWNATTEVAA